MTTTAAIAADSPLTAAAGARVARLGGNAVDIAVASALAATVSEVLMCSLGGSGFFMIHLPGRDPELIDGADMMPRVEQVPAEGPHWRRALLPYGDGIEVMAGQAAVGVPGMLAAAELAWRRHGRLPWREIATPAWELAQSEVPVGATMHKWLRLVGRVLFWQQPASRRVFFPDGERPLAQGESFRIPNLDQTWECLVREGAEAFYRGDLGAVFAEELQSDGGVVGRADLAAYHPLARRPLQMHSSGFQLALNPPPAVGGAAVGSLIGLVDRGWSSKATSAERDWLQARAQAHLLDDRRGPLADPHWDLARAERLLDETTFRQRLAALRCPNTTHLSVATSDGAVVGVTMSMGYGAGVLVSPLGIACNNSLGEPELNPAGYHRGPAGQRIVSNMAPTVAWHPDGRSLAFGSPGASRITTSIAQTWAWYALEQRPFEEAVDAPRLHIERLPQGLAAQFEPGIDTRLIGKQFHLRPFEDRDMYFGAVKLAGKDTRGRLTAVADRRREGAVEIVS